LLIPSHLRRFQALSDSSRLAKMVSTLQEANGESRLFAISG
jgi:hypothetical protein